MHVPRIAGAPRAFLTGLLTLACGAPAPSEEEVAVIQVRDRGEIVLRFFDDLAPRHVAAFKQLARIGFYDQTTFHRVIPGFMIQGGDPFSKDADPTNDGRGGSRYRLQPEFSDRPHRRGILSMARGSADDSARSQFFIMVADSDAWKQMLDGKYTVFGEVVHGMDVADAIAATPRDPANNRPLADVVMQSVRIEKRPGTGAR